MQVQESTFEEVAGRGPAPQQSPQNFNITPLSKLFLDFSGSHWLALSKSEVPASIFSNLPPVREFSLALPLWAHAFRNRDHWAPGNHKLNLRRDFLIGLTSLHLVADWIVPPLAEILRPCVNLERLTLDLYALRLEYGPFGDTFDQLVQDPIPLPKLRKVCLTRCTPETPRIMTMLWLPSLIELDVEMDWTHPEAVLTHWVPAIKPHSKIRSLRIRAPSIVAETLQALFLHDLPYVTDLTLDVPSAQTLPPLLAFLNQPPSEPHSAHTGRWLPALETLRLLDLPSSFDFGCVVKFVRERLPVNVTTGDSDATI